MGTGQALGRAITSLYSGAGETAAILCGDGGWSPWQSCEVAQPIQWPHSVLSAFNHLGRNLNYTFFSPCIYMVHKYFAI